MLELDIPTLILITALLGVIQLGAMVALAHIARRYAGITRWALANLAFVVCFGVMALRGQPDPIEAALIIVANLAALLSILLINDGVLRFLGIHPPLRSRPLQLLLLAWLVIFLWFTFADDNLSARVILAGVSQAPICLHTAWVLWRRTAPAERLAARLVAVTLAGVAALYILRAAGVALGVPVSSVTGPPALRQLMVLSALLSTVVINLGLASLVIQRLLADLSAAYDDAESHHARLQTVLDTLPVEFGIWDKDGLFLLQSARSRAVIGDAAGRTVLDLAPSEVLRRTWRDRTRRALAGEVVRERGTMRLGDEQHPAEIVMVAVHEGPLAGNVVVMRQDVIAQQQLEDALRASEARYRAIIESSPDALWILDPSGTILDTNPQGCRLAGLTREELVGANLQEFVPPETLVGLQELVSVVLARGMGSRDLTFTQRDGTLMHVNASVLALTLDGQQVILSFIRNISRRVQAEQALVFAKEEAEAASRAKSAFLAAMSHELRTPLNAILGYAEVLQMSTDAELTQRQRRWVQRIESSGRHLLELINDILDVARIEAGEEQLTLQPVDVADVCERSTQFVRTQALKMQLSLSLDLQHAPAQLLADERRLLQILVNLLSNAVKFTPEGGRIGLSVTPDAERAEVWFTVWDTGIGIAEDDLPRLFRPFEQLDTRLAREYEGSGLGLALVRRLTELHGGRVVVESAVGRGSHFTAILPWHVSEPRVPREAAKPADTPAPGVDSVPVLVVDDDTASRMVVVDYLTALGYRVREAVSAEAALALLAEELPAVVLMDIQMPQMDGLEAIRRIRAQPRLNGVPIIALTALAMSEDRERCLAAGADAYMSKPVRLSELAEMLASLR